MIVSGERIARRIKRLFGDESGVQVTDADVIDWLNDAMTEAATQNMSINLKRRFLPVFDGMPYAKFNDGDNLSGIHSVSYRQNADVSYLPLAFVPNRQFNELFPNWESKGESGTPAYYTVDVDHKIRLYPMPTATDGMGLSVLYNSYFDEYVDLTEEMEISPRYFQYLLEYCLMKAYEMDENWEAVDRKAAFIQSTLNTLASDDARADQSQYPVISSNVEDM